jgi:hypothetical protein
MIAKLIICPDAGWIKHAFDKVVSDLRTLKYARMWVPLAVAQVLHHPTHLPEQPGRMGAGGVSPWRIQLLSCNACAIKRARE